MLFIIDSELDPLTRTIPTPPSPRGVAIAAIVSAINSPIDEKSPSKMGSQCYFFSIITLL